MLQFPCPMGTVSGDLVESRKKNQKTTTTKTSKKQHAALASKACAGPGPPGLSFHLSDLQPAGTCLRAGSEERSENMLVRPFPMAGPLQGKRASCDISLQIIFIRFHSLRFQN